MATANASSSGQFPKQSYNAGYSSSGYEGIGQTPQDFNKGSYSSSGVGQQNKNQNISSSQTAGGTSEINSSVYGKAHVALSKVNVSKISIYQFKVSPTSLVFNSRFVILKLFKLFVVFPYA